MFYRFSPEGLLGVGILLIALFGLIINQKMLMKNIKKRYLILEFIFPLGFNIGIGLFTNGISALWS